MKLQPLLSYYNLGKGFGDKIVFQQLSGDFHTGIYSLFGPNGSGKSTLLSLLAGADDHYQGEIFILGKNGKNGKNGQDEKDGNNRRKETWEVNLLRTYLQDKPEFYPGVTGREFIEFICHLRKLSLKKYLQRACETFRADDFLDKQMEKLSLGQRKRIFLAVTLLDEVPVWILDEPSNGLDRDSWNGLATLIKEHGRDQLIFMASHDETLINAVNAERILMKIY